MFRVGLFWPYRLVGSRRVDGSPMFFLGGGGGNWEDGATKGGMVACGRESLEIVCRGRGTYSSAMALFLHGVQRMQYITRFPSNPLMIRVPFFLLFSFNKETPK